MTQGYFERNLPAPLADLGELVGDLRWDDCPAAQHLWSRLEPEVWQHTENPSLVLQSARQERIEAAARDEQLLGQLEKWRRAIRDYYARDPEYRSLDPDGTLKRVAYFSMEFGVSESLPIYSGGLGMLAGDHLKTASDLGVPLIGIGLLYQQGYFRQVISATGEQLEAYPFNDPGSLPVRPVTDADGQWLRVLLPLPGRALFLKVWQARVGRVPLYLLDSNDAMNTAWDRAITAQLYGSGGEKRLLQEIVLGVGGWHLIERMRLEVDVCHLNEGHAAFAVLARAAEFSKKHDVPLRAAFRAMRAGNVFTTHTPVEAAFDCFDPDLVTTYAQPFLDEVGLPAKTFLAMGRRDRDDPREPFNMAWLAVRGACHINAVSQLHSHVSRDLFGVLFPRWPHNEIPVRPITNGIHVPTWASSRASELWGDGEGGDRWLNGVENVADRIEQCSADEIWEFRTQQREALLRYVRARYARQLESVGRAPDQRGWQHVLDPNVLTIGFARRFATYKRANLLLAQPDRLRRMLLDQRRPVQLIIAGKAHPNDGYGKALIKQMTQFLATPELRGRAIFLEDYDMVLGQHLVAGVDVWLNTPLRLNEACGTSGMKVLVNGGLNVSVLDGWWDEAVECDETSSMRPGWIVGTREGGSIDELNRRDAESLFTVLENEVIPEFYVRDADGIPHRWIERVKASMMQLTPRFSANRMMHDYVNDAYLPAARAVALRTADNARIASEILQWTDKLVADWHHVRIGQVRRHQHDDHQEISVECWLDAIPAESIRVELYADPLDGTSPTRIQLRKCHELPGSVNGFVFCGEVNFDRPLSDYTVRVVPHHPHAFLPLENHCILWEQ